MLTDITTALKEGGQKALVPFFTAGYPDEDTCIALIKEAADAGANVVEIGIPFSDPLADGPVIQNSSQVALAQGMTLSRSLDLCARLKSTVNIPLVIMSYCNPILAMGIENFAHRAHQAGVQGVILPDVPLEESPVFRKALSEAQVEMIQLVAPTTGPNRMAAIADASRGFLYAVSITGITGSESPSESSLAKMARGIRFQSDLPLYAGFGISTAEHARAAAIHCDGVIVGSALMRIFDQAPSPQVGTQRVGAFLCGLRKALDGKPHPITIQGEAS
jgi:tryptophan synthase alpha chain